MNMEELYFIDPNELFDKGLQEDIQRFDNFIIDLRKTGIPIRRIKVIDPVTYKESKIDPMKKGGVYDYRLFSLIPSNRLMGRSFELLFGSGMIEYERGEGKFDFSFSYIPENRIEDEILNRLKLRYFKEDVYSIRKYPASIRSIQRAHREMERVDEKLKLAEKISRTIDRLLK